MESQDIIYSLFFYAIAAVLIVAALGVVFLPKIVYSAVSMILAFIAVAGIFVLLNADFVAVAQIIIYAVGITIVMIFAIMLTEAKEDKKLWIAVKFRSLFAFGIAGAFFLIILITTTNGLTALSQETGFFAIKPPSAEMIQILQTEGTTATLGKQLLTKYALPFELLSILLLATIFGAVVIAGKSKNNLTNPINDSLEEK